MPGTEWVTALAAGFGLLLCCILVFPQQIVNREVISGEITQADRLKAMNDVRATLAHGLAGALLLFGAWATWNQVQATSKQVAMSAKQQTTERFTRAVDQLGSKSPDVRMGGIVGLGQLASSAETDADRLRIVQILAGFVRHHARPVCEEHFLEFVSSWCRP